jgi:hypothetical protein
MDSGFRWNDEKSLPRKGLQDEESLDGKKIFLMVSLSNHATWASKRSYIAFSE